MAGSALRLPRRPDQGVPVPQSPSPALAVPSPARSSAWGLASLALAVLLSSLGTSIANVALPTLAREFGASFQAVQWVVLAYLLAVTTALVIVGRLGDLLGRRRLMLAGFVVFVIGSAASAGAGGLGVLVAARAVQGLGAAVMMALSMALVGDAVPEARAGRAMGLLGATSALGTALGPSLGGALVGWQGWPAIFQATTALGVIAGAIGARHLPHDATQARRRGAFDLPGAVLLAAALATYALALTLPAGSSAGRRIALLAAALGLAGAFLVVESRSRSPLMQLGLFRQAGIGSAFATSALVNTVAMTTLVVGPFHLSRALGLAPAAVGMVMTIGPLVAAMAGVPAGRAVDRFGTRRVTRFGLLLMGSGCAGFAVLPVAAGVPGYVLPLVTTTAGFAIFQAANNTAVVTTAAASQRGVISALLTLSRNLGLVTAASAMGAVFLAASGAPEIALADAAAVAEGTRTTFAVGALLVAIAFAATRQPRPRNDGWLSDERAAASAALPPPAPPARPC